MTQLVALTAWELYLQILLRTLTVTIVVALETELGPIPIVLVDEKRKEKKKRKSFFITSSNNIKLGLVTQQPLPSRKLDRERYTMAPSIKLVRPKNS